MGAHYQQIVTEICHLAQMLLLDPKMELAREPPAKMSGTCRNYHTELGPWEKYEIFDFGQF